MLTVNTDSNKGWIPAYRPILPQVGEKVVVRTQEGAELNAVYQETEPGSSFVTGWFENPQTNNIITGVVCWKLV